MNKPLALTLGDPAGIGPEILVAALCERKRNGPSHPIRVYGSRAVFERAQEASADPLARSLEVDLVDTGAVGHWQPGAATADGGRAAIAAIEAAVADCLTGDCRALVTAPINKTALKLAGSPFPGHTEMLAALCGVPKVAMMFAAEGLHVILVTIHQSLREAIIAITPQRVAEIIRMGDAAARWLALPAGRRARIAVAGLNPHAGEDGLFGREEIEVIAPAIAQCAQEGIAVSGPYPPDTVFMRARQGEFDLVVAMLHDHGLIAVKLDGIERAVNVTLGLPFLRTSVDHGTAYEIAWQGRASAANLLHVLNWTEERLC